MERRDFLKFLGMASSATVLTSCGIEKSTEKIIPLLVPHTEPDYLPGEPMFRHSVCTECTANCGMEVRLVEFNAIKVDGIKNHPVNDGALCLRGQSSLMRLYHPRRLKTPVRRKGNITEMERLQGQDLEQITWPQAYELILKKLNEAKSAGQQNVYLSGSNGGAVADLRKDFSAATGVETLPAYEPYSHANLRQAYQQVLGRREVPLYRIAEADFLLTVGADIVETFVNPVSNATQLAKARDKNRLQWKHVEPHASLTGFKADEVLKVKPGSEGHLLAFLLHYLTDSGVAKHSLPVQIANRLPEVSKSDAAQATGLSGQQLEALGAALVNARNPLLIAGGVATEQPGGLGVAALAALIQHASGMIGTTVDFAAAQITGNVGTMKDLAGLAERLNNNQIGVIFISGANPVGTAPAAIGFTEALGKAAFRVAFSDIIDETAAQCDLILPLSHTLESWGEVSQRADVVALHQPVLKEKLFDTRSEGEILLELTQLQRNGQTGDSYETWLKKRWESRYGAANVENLIQKGYVQNENARVQVALQSTGAEAVLGELQLNPPPSGAVAYVLPSIRTFDGRSSVLPLTTEVPDPLTTISYGRWVSVSEASAADLGLEEKSLVRKNRDEISLEVNGVSNTYGSFVQPGLPKDVYTVYRDQVDPAILSFDPQTGECYARVDQVTLARTGKTRPLAIMAGAIEQGHRNITREEHKHEIPWLEGQEHEKTLYPDPHDRYETYRWAISVDMESCIGCAACVAACYIENNVPVVGEEENLKGREMSWLRIQPYYFEDGTMDSLVMLCQQCDFAPCENVCPVYATYHNEEGLNVMVYNRCVGTRYCHNNCPYKVRRFNWFDWTDEGAWQEPMTRMLNPDVWVRPKGVMEKCTFCHQRIRRAKDLARDEKRLVRDGDVKTACQEACPTNAITFGNYLDKQSEVYKKSQSDRKFQVLAELGVGPAVHYLRKEEQA